MNRTHSVGHEHCPLRGHAAGHRARELRSLARGYTYIGLMLVIAIMGVWLVAVSQVYQTMQKREKEEELLFVGDQYRRALMGYYASTAGYPKQLEDLLKDPRFPAVRRYLRKIYPDPITGKTEWGLVKGPNDVITGVYSLSEDEPMKKSGFALVDQAFEGKSKYSEWVFLPRIGRTPAPGVTGVPSVAPGVAPAGNQPPITPPGAARAAPGVVFTTPAQMGQGGR